MLRSIGLFIALSLAGLSHAVEVRPEINGVMDATCRGTLGTCPTWVTESRYSGQININGEYVSVQDISVQDSLYSAVFVFGDNAKISNMELGWMGDAGIRTGTGTSGQLIFNNTVHHGAYAEYADEVLGDPSFSGVPTGNPPMIQAHVDNSSSPSTSFAAIYGNRIYTSYREGIGCYRVQERAAAGGACWIVGNIISNVRSVGIYFANSSGIAESNIVYSATDDDWGYVPAGLVAGKEGTGIGFDDCDDCYFRNNLVVNLTTCHSSIFQNSAISAGEGNSLKGWYNTCILPTSTSSDGAVYRTAKVEMTENELKNSIGYAPNSSKQCEYKANLTVATNFWDSTVNEAACSDAGDVIGTPSLVGSLSATYTIASPPDPDDYEYSGAGVDGVGDATPMTSTVFADGHFHHYDDLGWWDDQGYTKPSLAQLKKAADVDFKGKDRDDVNPDIGAFEF